MIKDPIIEEIHQIRDQLAAHFNYDVYAIVADAQTRQHEYEDHPVVSFSPKLISAEEKSIAEIKDRVSELIDKEKTTGLSAEETAELDDYMQLEFLGRLAKARAHQSQHIAEI
ncbi:MAG: hypothetical protein MOB07_12290 [Acidobacteria bacterium]|nr:hypothetical protein [Acidobacteriota bacterium]